jgi:hypothetical protein
MSPQLQSYADTFRQAEAEILHVTQPLSDDAFNWKPAPETWSIGECIEHLNRVAEAFLPRLEDAARRTEPTGQGPFTYGFIARKMIDSIGPEGPALSTSRTLNPSGDGPRSTIDPVQALQAFSDATERFVAVCASADGLDIAKIKVSYPFFRLLRLPLGAFLHIAGLHALRHARQAAEVRSETDFPLGSGPLVTEPAP